MMREQVQRPRERRRRRLVAGEQQGDELVQELLVADGHPVVETDGHEPRQDVVAGVPRPVTALAQLLAEDRVDRGAELAQTRRCAIAARSAHDQPGQLPRRGGRRLDQTGQERAQAGPPVRVVDSEHDAHDHLERQRLRARERGEGPRVGPAVHGPFGDLADGGLEGAHALAMERRHEGAAAGEVLGTVREHHRARAHRRLERRPATPGRLVPRVGVDGAHELRLADDHHRPAKSAATQGEDVAVTAPAALEERDRPQHPAQRLDDRREGRPGWQRVHERQLSHGAVCPGRWGVEASPGCRRRTG